MSYAMATDRNGKVWVVDFDTEDEMPLAYMFKEAEEGVMTKNVLVGNGDKRILCDLEPLKSGMKSGGQGDVYFQGNQDCIKVLHDPAEASIQLATIAKILVHREKLYDKVRLVSASPRELVWDEKGQRIIGYTMETFLGWNSMSKLLTHFDSEELGMSLDMVGFLLEDLCKTIRLVHNQGFVIGDLNPSNVLFKLDKTKSNGVFEIRIIDVDSWSVYRSDLGIEFAAKILNTNLVYHPDIIQADREHRAWPNFTPNHDWWAFACISWAVLTKDDPFVTGKIDGLDREDRILNNHTANRAVTVRLHPESGPAIQALGPKLRIYLDRCLKHKVLRPFHDKVLNEFARGVQKCTKCGFTAHVSAVICPKCATLLTDNPPLMAANSHFELVANIDVVIPAGYDGIKTARTLDSFRDINLKDANSLRERYGKPNYYHNSASEEKFRKVTRELVPGRKLKAKIFQVSSEMSLEDCLEFLKNQGALLVGAQGYYLDPTHGMESELPKRSRLISFDERDILWKGSRGYHMVPYVIALPRCEKLYLDSSLPWNQQPIGGHLCILCLCDK